MAYQNRNNSNKNSGKNHFPKESSKALEVKNKLKKITADTFVQLVFDKSFLQNVLALREVETWQAITNAFCETFRFQEKAETPFELEGKAIQQCFYFHMLAQYVKDEIHKVFVYACGWIGGRPSDMQYCKEGLEVLLKQLSPEYEERVHSFYHELLIIKKNAEEKKTDPEMETELERLKGLMLSEKEEPGDNSAIRVLTYAFLSFLKKYRNDLELSFIEKDLFLDINGEQVELVIHGESRKLVYTKGNYPEDLFEIFKGILKTEEYKTINECGTYIYGLISCFSKDKPLPYLEKLKNFDEMKGNTKEIEKRLFGNLMVDFENMDAWDMLSKFFHGHREHQMRSAIYLIELLKFPKAAYAKDIVYAYFLPIVQHMDNDSKHPNFMVNQWYLLKNTREEKKYATYWKEFCKKLERWNDIRELGEKDNQEEILCRYFEVAGDVVREKDSPEWKRAVGRIAYTLITMQNKGKQQEEKISRLLFYCKKDCIFEQYLFEKREIEDGRLRFVNGKMLLHVLLLSALRSNLSDVAIENVIKVNKNHLLKRAIKESNYFSSSEKKYWEALKKYSESKAGKEYGRLFLVQQEILRAYPMELPVQKISEYSRETENDFLAIMDYCADIYSDSYTMQNSIVYELTRYLSRHSMYPKELLEFQLLKTTVRQLELMERGSNAEYMLRLAKNVHALEKICLIPSEDLQNRIRKVDEKLARAGSEYGEKMAKYHQALDRLLGCSELGQDMKRRIIYCGITNYWDKFVEGISGYHLSKEAARVFNEYLKEINYYVFRRCVLQKLEDELKTEIGESFENRAKLRERLNCYIASTLYCKTEDMPTKVLSEACEMICNVFVDVKKEEDIYFLMDKLSLALSSNNKNWSVLERNIEELCTFEDKKLGSYRVITILSAVIVSIFEYEDVIKLIHRMSCDREKAVYAMLLLYELSIRFQKEVSMDDMYYYFCIAAAWQREYKKAREAYENLVNLEGNSIDVIKLKNEILDKMERLNFCVDATIMKKGEVLNEGLFTLSFMKAEKTTEFFETLESRFLSETEPHKKCRLAEQMLYWLRYSGINYSTYAYNDYVLQWFGAQLKITDIYEEKLRWTAELFEASVYESFVPTNKSQESVLYKALTEAVKEIFDYAEVSMPLKGTLTTDKIKVAGHKLQELIELYSKLSEKTRQTMFDYTEVIRCLQGLNTSEESEVMKNLQSEVLNNSPAKQFIENVLVALKRRQNGGFEFTVLNMADDTTNTLFYQIKNCSGEHVDKLYVGLVLEETLVKETKLSKLKSTDTFAACFEGLKEDYTKYSVHLYEKSQKRKTVFESGNYVFDSRSWKKADSSSVAELKNLCVDKAFSEWEICYENQEHIILKYNHDEILKELTERIQVYCTENQVEYKELDFGDKVFTLEDVKKEVSANSVVVWKNYASALAYMERVAWHRIYSKQEFPEVYFVFCYLEDGNLYSQKPGNYVNENDIYVSEIVAKKTLKECVGRYGVTKNSEGQKVRLTFLDQTLECLERCTNANIPEALEKKKEFLLKGWDLERRYVYPSDIVESFGLEGAEDTTALIRRQDAYEYDAKESVTTLLRVMPELPTERRDEISHLLINAGMLPNSMQVGALYAGNVEQTQNQFLLQDGANAAIQTGGVQVNNTAYVTNFIQQVFGADINAEEQIKKAEEEIRSGLENEYEERLKEAEERAAAAEKRAKAAQKNYEELRDAPGADEEELYEAVAVAKAAADEAKAELEETKALKNLLEEKNEELNAQIKADSEASVEEKIKKLLREKMSDLVETVSEVDMSGTLFGITPEELEATVAVIRQFGYEENYKFATFLHYIFTILKELADTEQGRELTMDYSAVSLLYAKIYEGMLKKLHFMIYRAKLPNENTKVSNAVFGCLYADKVNQITMGSYVYPINHVDASNGYPKLNDVSSVLADATTNSVEWQLHGAKAKKLEDLRNGSAHGKNEGGSLGALDTLKEITEILFKKEAGLSELERIVKLREDFNEECHRATAAPGFCITNDTLNKYISSMDMIFTVTGYYYDNNNQGYVWNGNVDCMEGAVFAKAFSDNIPSEFARIQNPRGKCFRTRIEKVLQNRQGNLYFSVSVLEEITV